MRAACKNRRLVNGCDCRFRAGQTAHNKGKKGWHAGEAGKGAVATRFRPGHRPWNCRPVGSERRIKHASGWYAVEVKVAEPDVWRYKHVLVWEAAHGPVPPGHAIIFADQNRENYALDNLILVTRGELAVLNKQHLIVADAELTKSGIAVAEVLLKMHERRRKNGRKTKI